MPGCVPSQAAIDERCKERPVCDGPCGRTLMAYTAVALEGGIFPADLLERIAAGEAEG